MDALHRGFLSRADDYAREMIDIGRRAGDPRALSLGLRLLNSNAMVNDGYRAALEFGQQGLSAAITPMEEFTAINNNANSLVPLKRLPEGLSMLEEARRRYTEKGCATLLITTDPIWGVAQMIQGKLAEGIGFIKKAIIRSEQKGYRRGGRLVPPDSLLCLYRCPASQRKAAAWWRHPARPSLPGVLKLTGIRVIDRMMDPVRNNRQVDSEGSHHAKINMPFGPTPLSKRVDAALARLGD
jgi:hypothetical protein